jgi:hypothetical protein
MLSKDELLKRTNNGLDVFRYYIPGQWRVGRNFLNPFYDDHKASCNIYFDRKNGCYRVKDFGNDDFSGDCFFFVGKLKGLDCESSKGFVKILQTINRDLNLGLNGDDIPHLTPTSPVTKPGQRLEQAAEPKKTKPFSVNQQGFSAKELLFWKQYGITSEILRLYKVISLKEFQSENNDGEPFSLKSSEQEPMFGYCEKRYVKIYRPFSEIRFLYGGNFGENYCFGLEQLPIKGDTLFITGGEKDVLSLAVRGFHAICFNSETSTIPDSIIRKLTHRFKHIVLLYDVDKTGLDSSRKQQQQLSEFGVKRLILPLSGSKADKDVSDYFKSGNTREDFVQLFLEFLDTLYSETMAILKPCEIDFGNPPVKSEMIISINDVPIGTQGNLLGITGANLYTQINLER